METKRGRGELGGGQVVKVAVDASPPPQLHEFDSALAEEGPLGGVALLRAASPSLP